MKNDNGRILAPYLDHYSHVKKDGNDFFVVVDSDSYDYDFSGTGGYPNRCQPEEGREYDYACANCNFGTDDSSDLTETEDGDLCSDCIPGYIEAIQNSSGGTIYCHESNTREDCDGTVYTQWYADSNLTYLDGEYHTSDCPHLETECANCEYRTTDADNDLEDGLCSDCMETHNAEIERKEYEREHQTMLAY